VGAGPLRTIYEPFIQNLRVVLSNDWRKKYDKHTSQLRAARHPDCFVSGPVGLHRGGLSGCGDSNEPQQEGTENIIGDARKP
jgi:hypothetical protein